MRVTCYGQVVESWLCILYKWWIGHLYYAKYGEYLTLVMGCYSMEARLNTMEYCHRISNEYQSHFISARNSSQKDFTPEAKGFQIGETLSSSKLFSKGFRLSFKYLSIIVWVSASRQKFSQIKFDRNFWGCLIILAPLSIKVSHNAGDYNNPYYTHKNTPCVLMLTRSMWVGKWLGLVDRTVVV